MWGKITCDRLGELISTPRSAARRNPSWASRGAGNTGFLFQGLCPRPPPATFVALHSDCTQSGCCADGLRPLYPHNQGSAVGRLCRLFEERTANPAFCFRGFAPGPPRPLSPFILTARSQDVVRMGYAHCIRTTRARRSGGCAASVKFRQRIRPTNGLHLRYPRHPVQEGSDEALPSPPYENQKNQNIQIH